MTNHEDPSHAEDLTPHRRALKRRAPSADELGEPTLIIVVVATLLSVVGAVWLLGAVSATWALVLAAITELVGLFVLIATLVWQLSDGAGRRTCDRRPTPVKVVPPIRTRRQLRNGALNTPAAAPARHSQVRTVRPRTPTA